MDNGFLKALILVGVLAYIVSPVDLMPGCPIDDIIVFFDRDGRTEEGCYQLNM